MQKVTSCSHNRYILTLPQCWITTVPALWYTWKQIQVFGSNQWGNSTYREYSPEAKAWFVIFWTCHVGTSSKKSMNRRRRIKANNYLSCQKCWFWWHVLGNYLHILFNIANSWSCLIFLFPFPSQNVHFTVFKTTNQLLPNHGYTASSDSPLIASNSALYLVLPPTKQILFILFTAGTSKHYFKLFHLRSCWQLEFRDIAFYI